MIIMVNKTSLLPLFFLVSRLAKDPLALARNLCYLSIASLAGGLPGLIRRGLIETRQRQISKVGPLDRAAIAQMEARHRAEGLAILFDRGQRMGRQPNQRFAQNFGAVRVQMTGGRAVRSVGATNDSHSLFSRTLRQPCLDHREQDRRQDTLIEAILLFSGYWAKIRS